MLLYRVRLCASLIWSALRPGRPRVARRAWQQRELGRTSAQRADAARGRRPSSWASQSEARLTAWLSWSGAGRTAGPGGSGRRTWSCVSGATAPAAGPMQLVTDLSSLESAHDEERSP